MNRFLAVLFCVSLASVTFTRCSEDCVPNFVDPDDIIYLNIVNSTGNSIIRYAGNALPADSVRVTNLGSGAAVSRTLSKDSILTIENFDKTNSAVNRFKIEVGAPGVRKPDTVEITINRATIIDNCNREIERARFSSVKVNTTVRCTSCGYNQVFLVQK